MDSSHRKGEVMRNRVFRALFAISLGLVLLGAFTVSVQAQIAKSGSSSLIYSWHAEGIMHVQDEENTIGVATAHGVIINRDGSGFLHDVPTDCAASFRPGNDSGYCVSKDADGDLVYMNWICSYDAEGWCVGEFDWVAGTGKYQGISGKNKLRYKAFGFRTGTPDEKGTPTDFEGYGIWEGDWRLP